ncbi:MAG TPA: BamA/TamA family outer membrane protein, partial [Kiloniellales bacterium]|nr:BamA/TamA family outer membrane protein [Kiloniellales bacterium]
GLPLTATRDDRDDLLDPTRGTRLSLTLTPYGGVGDQSLAFLRSTLGGTAYYAIDEGRRFVVAGRARLGSILGDDTEEIPANKRFYAGGGGSIRGYEFQKVGPLDENNEPLGGRSLVELGVELRIRVTEEIGIVPFLDGGTVFDSPYPDFEEDLRWATGLGLRYFTAIGPLRLDVAVPLDKREGIDDDYQFYISLGQAF